MTDIKFRGFSNAITEKAYASCLEDGEFAEMVMGKVPLKSSDTRIDPAHIQEYVELCWDYAPDKNNQENDYTPNWKELAVRVNLDYLAKKLVTK